MVIFWEVLLGIGLLTCAVTPVSGAPRWWEPYVPDSHTTALWHLDEMSADESPIVYDETANNNDGVVTGAVLDTGRFGNSLRFDGVNDFVVVRDSMTVSAWPITVEAWVKPLPRPLPPPPYPPGTPWGYVASKSNDYTLVVTYSTQYDPPTASTVWWSVCVESGVGSGWQQGVGAPIDDPDTPEIEGVNLLDGNWHHIAGVYDNEVSVDESGIVHANGMTESIYVDGVLQETLPIPSNSWWGTQHDLEFGRQWSTGENPGGYHFYMGYIDEVRISDIDRFGTRSIAIPSSGWIQFANDGKEPVYWLDSTVTDGTDTYLVADAEAAGWIQASAYSWDGTNFSLIPNDDDHLRPGRAYSLWSNTGGLTLHMPKYTQD
jgi:hypothetical protein